MRRALMWFRRDLRLADHPALAAAADAADEVVPLFVLDPALLAPAGAPRVAFLLRSLRILDRDLGGRLAVRAGDPNRVVPEVQREAGADAVFVSADFGPYGAARDDALDLVAVGSPYVADPGTVTKADGTPYRVFTPFYRVWRDRVGQPVAHPRRDVRWADASLARDPLPDEPDVGDAALPPAGERAAHEQLDAFLTHVERYADERDRPDLDATSRLSTYLRWGVLHPRQVLARLDDSRGAEVLRSELAWREFYADVLWHRPESARASAGPEWDDGRDADLRFDAWCAGRTGFPFVDAGMRQLLGEAWMHNRARMVVASFLVKDLHVDWRRGARWFMSRLVDGDLASNQHGWQWVAGTGTDAAPFHRIFNPVSQGQRFDPDGDYVRRWVPELRGVRGRAVHEPWLLAGGLPNGYPAPIVDHAEERAEALRRWGLFRRRG